MSTPETNIYTESGHQLITNNVYTAAATIGMTTSYTYDAMGRAMKRSSGTTTGNFVDIEAYEYDGNTGGGNSLMTRRIAYLGSSSLDRVYDFVYDERGRLKVAKAPFDGGGSPVYYGPHALTDYDNLNRAVATATYSNGTSLSASSVTSGTTGRLSLSQSYYDEAGRVWKTSRHEITQGGGSAGASTATLDAVSWYDAAGRVIASRSANVSKTLYDRLGRVIKSYTLAKLGSTMYGDLYDASTGTTLIDPDDVVMEESRTYRDEETGAALMQVQVSRAHDNTTRTGVLFA